jgi:hypothetical protein
MLGVIFTTTTMVTTMNKVIVEIRRLMDSMMDKIKSLADEG